MQETIISVDVMCDWQGKPPIYRIYVDDDLLTERTYIWANPEQYVKENVIVEIEPGVHTFRVEPICPTDKFICRNFTVNKQPTPLIHNRFFVE